MGNDAFAIGVLASSPTPRPGNLVSPPNPTPTVDDPVPAPTPSPVASPTPAPTASPTTPLQTMTADQIRAVPQQVTVQGKVLTATAAAWLNLIPTTNPPTNATNATFHLVAKDGSVIPAALHIDRISVAKTEEVWASTNVTNKSSATALDASIHNGSEWERGAAVDIVADFYDSNGQRFQLRSTSTVITAAF